MPNETALRDSFFEHYGQRLRSGDAAVFVGAGFSVGAGYVDWRELLRDIAEEIDLDVDQESDLVAVAQYHMNTFRNRSALNRRIIEAFTSRSALSENHRLLARLPLRTIWTTNYDALIETAYSQAGKMCQPIASVDAISAPWPRRDVALYKMHGSVDAPAQAVITKDDYETYRATREEFITVLTSHLLTKTFLFLGFSFTDPNLDYLLAWVRSHRRENPAEHYWITKEVEPKGADSEAHAEYEYATRKQRLRAEDMNRYGIRTIFVKSYAEIADILQRLTDIFRERTVFVSGSAFEYGDLGHDRIEHLSRGIAEALVREEFRIVTGFGLGIGGPVILGAISALHQNTAVRLEDRVLLRQFDLQRSGPERVAAHRQHRHELLEQAGFGIFIAGNRDEGGQAVVADGVLEEFELAVEHGVYPIPIGATGYAAKMIWAQVVAQPDTYYGDKTDRLVGDLKLLGDPSSTNEVLIAAVMRIIKTIAS
ncbi:SIR2 family protein [soil metagenome]